MRVVIAEDETLLREGLHRLLAESGLTVTGVAGDADELMAEVARTLPQVVVTDIRMPPGRSDDGLRAALAIRARHPGVGVMVLSQFVQQRYALALIGDDAAGVGYQLKERVADVDQFCSDVRLVGSGGTALDPEVIAVLLDRAQRAAHPLDRLTPRQQEVLRLVAQGRSNLAIARALTVSEKAVDQHISRIYDVLDLPREAEHHRRVLAVVRYLTRPGPPGNR